MACRFRTCVVLSSASAVGVLLVAARSWTGLVSTQPPVGRKVEIEISTRNSAVETSIRESGQSATASFDQNPIDDIDGIGTSQPPNLAEKSLLNDNIMKPKLALDGNVPKKTSPFQRNFETNTVDNDGRPEYLKAPPNPDVEAALRQCVKASQVFSESEVEPILEVLQQSIDLTPMSENGKFDHWLVGPLVFTQLRKGEGVGIAEAFHHAWSVLGCGKMFFTKTEVRVRPGRERCFSLFASPAASHLFPWGFFDPDTRKQEVPDLQKIIGIRGNLPFGACRFLKSDCSYTTVLLEPVERYISHVQTECTGSQHFRECETSLAEFTHAARRGEISFYGIDNYQTRMLAGDGSLDANSMPCFSAETCVRTEMFKVGPDQIKAAIRNLVFHYPVWGVSGDIPRFAQRLRSVYGYQFHLLYKERTSIDLELGMNLTLDYTARKEIEELNAADVTLYNFARCVLDAGSPRFS